MRKILKNVIIALIIFVGFNINAKASMVYVCPEHVNLLRLPFTSKCTKNDVTSSPFDVSSYLETYLASHRGKQFSGWELTADIGELFNIVSVDKNKLIISDTERFYILVIPIEIYATWEDASTYLITLNANGGVGGTSSIREKYNTGWYDTDNNGISSVSVPTKAGYIFDGYYTSNGVKIIDKNGSIIANDLTFTSNMTITAKWNLITYSMNYDLAGGGTTPANPTVYTVESENITLNNPTKAGYIFKGWVGTGLTEPTMSVVIPQGSTGNKNYTATWEVEEYTINYNLAGGEATPANPTSYTVESENITLNNPTKAGYRFTGWVGTGLTEPTMNIVIPQGSTENQEYTATWEPIIYTINYNLDGGEVTPANPASYTIESENITLNNPTKAGYGFTGWEGTGLNEPTMNVVILTGSIGDRRYLAGWRKLDPAETTGEGGSDLDDIELPIEDVINTSTDINQEDYSNPNSVSSLNPQTGDDIIIYVSLLALSSMGFVISKKRLFN